MNIKKKAGFAIGRACFFVIAGEKMDDILWLDEQESAEFEKILANLQPNRSTREEFMRIIA